MKLTNQTLAWLSAAVIVLTVTAAGAIFMTLRVGQPFYVYGQLVGFNADAFGKLQATLDATERRCQAQATDSATRLNALQLELAQLKERDQNEQSKAKAIAQQNWFPVADAKFEAGSRMVWRHPDSELALALESTTSYPPELVFRTNLPAPYNRLRFKSAESQWIVSRDQWRYRLTATDLHAPTIRVERQAKHAP